MELYYPYGEKEIEYLKSRDKKLAAVIETIGHIDRPVIPDVFCALIHSVVGQQISSKAHATVWARINERFSPVTPEHFDALPADELQSCGMTMKKAGYIKEIARRAATGELDLEALKSMGDSEVCEELTKLPGIGVWTAQMLLTFSLLRPDIISYGDLAIRRGMRMVYRHKELTPALFEKYRKRLSPYGTVASLYFWAVSAGAVPGLSDPGEK